MLSFLASFILHLLCDEIVLDLQVDRNPKAEHWHTCEAVRTLLVGQGARYLKYLAF